MKKLFWFTVEPLRNLLGQNRLQWQFHIGGGEECQGVEAGDGIQFLMLFIKDK